ncbi:hypothetical protein [Mycoplasma sp. Mirounga ES2805-ORL]|uniref:hypothetical protein n=1 Tax=Mycoplasma sp. Mirounga ES2805-ORL TaxID=754514 RepID=UPI00197B673E|nr:hypothetical protein [Mycoplasma sp. Mirounga ES2805-ORL]QSF13597.1 hypothetical protein JXZ90_02945 [Mycoplasma sp. Mirounga ES2805-ORL]
MKNYIWLFSSALVVILIAIFLMIFLIVRKNILNKYSSQIKNYYTTLTTNKGEVSITILRFASISKTHKNNLEKKDKLEKLDFKMNECASDMNDIIKNWRKSIKKYSLIESKKYSLQASKTMDKYLKYYEKFETIADELNKYWNTIDLVAINSHNILNKLEEYLDDQKDKLTHSYNFLKDELSDLNYQTGIFDDQKITSEIKHVSKELNEHEKRIKTFIKKLDHFVNIEWALFHNMPKVLNELKNNIKNVDFVKFEETLNSLVQKYCEIPYQDVVKSIKKWYRDLFCINKDSSSLDSFNKYIEKQSIVIHNELDAIKENLDAYILSDEIKYVNEFKSMMSNLKRINFELNDFEKNLYSNNINSISKYKDIMESIIEWVGKYNNYAFEANKYELINQYQSKYFDVINLWYLKVLTMRSFLEPSQDNEREFTKLIKSHVYIENDFEKNKKVGKTKIWSEFLNNLNSLLIKVMTANTYKKMCNELIFSLNQYRFSPEVNDVLLIVSDKLRKKEYEDAYDTLAKFLKKEKKYVL